MWNYEKLKKDKFLCKKVSSKNVDIDSNFIVFDANSALFSQIEIILQILYEISRIFCGFYSTVSIQFLVMKKLLFIDLSQECRLLYPSLPLKKSPHIPTNFKVCARWKCLDKQLKICHIFETRLKNSFSFRASEVGWKTEGKIYFWGVSLILKT